MKSPPFLIGAIALALAGCGGSGTSAGTLPSSTVRRNVPFDTYQYNVVGSYTQTGAVTNAATSGTATEQYTSDTFNGLAAVEDAVVVTLNEQNGPKILNDITQYNTSWVAIGQSDMGTTEVISAEGLELPATLSLTTSTSAVEILANGTHVTVSLNVVGYGMVTTPAGTFNCWTIQQTKTWSDGLVVAETISFSPDIGGAVKVVATDTYTNGYSDSVTWTLTSDTVRLTPG